MSDSDLTAPNRICAKCREVYPATRRFFGKNNRSPDGCSSRCRVCSLRSPVNRKRIAATMLAPDGHRFCTGCEEILPEEMFGKDRYGRGGLKAQCRECKRAEHDPDYYRRWREANRERKASSDKAYVERNREKLEVYWKAYREEHREWLAQWQKRYRKEHPEMYRQYGREKYARRKAAEGSYTRDEVWQMYEDQGGLCAYCETPLFGSFQVEHMIPIARGGRNDWSNIAIACKDCNQSKHAKTVEEFMRRKARETVNREREGEVA